MGDDEWHRILFLRPNVNEMNVQPIDLGDEIRNGVYSCLDLAPVVVRGPIPREFLRRGKPDALRFITHRFSFGPLRRLDASAQIGKIGFRKTHMKRTNVGTTAGLSCIIGQSSSHGFRASGKAEKTQLARGSGCGGSTQEATAIEIGHLVIPMRGLRFNSEYAMRGGV